MSRKLFKAIFVFSLGLVLLGAFAVSAQADGKYTGHFGWHAVGQIFEIEEGHLFWVGEFTGIFFNDDGKGAFHQMSTQCPGVNDIYDGVGHLHGYCMMTDADGDKAVLVWLCEGPAGEACSGTFDWTSGTGKYAGIHGKNTFQSTNVTESEGHVAWQGEWKLK